MSTQTHTKREKGQALFLSALMVLSVFAMSAAFAGAAAAQEGFTVTVEDENGDPIADATVTIDGTDEVTGEDGTAVFNDVAVDQNAELTVTADGYDDYDQTLTPDVIETGEYTVTMNDADDGDEADDGDGVEDGDDATAGDGEDADTEDGDDADADDGEDADEEGDATDSAFDSANYSEEAGDVVEFTIDMEHADEAVVVLEDEDGNYWADLHVDSGDQDEVNVSFNSYNAGQEGADAFSTDSEDTQVTVHNERTITDGTHLNPGAYTLDLYVNEDGDSITVESVDDGDRADVEDLELAYTSELELSEGSIGDSTSGVAPGDAELDGETDVEDLEDATTNGDAVAEGDYFVVGVDASGVFGFLAEDGFSEDGPISFEMEQTNPDTYDAPEQFDHDDVEIVEDPEDNRLFFILDTDDTVEAGAEYDVTFSVSEDFGYADEDTESTTSFSVVERSVEVTGDFDEDDRLQVEQSEESTVTGESNIAPGSEVQIRLNLGAPDHPTLTETAEVQDDGTVEAAFDLSDREVGEELDVQIEDSNGDASDEVNAILVESADDYDQAPHTVTITVTDADGEPVEDAEVEIDGQTETTDSNGEATFELHHGEYDVTATHDGESASGTITVDDETADTGSLTLGEEDAGEISDPADETDDDTGADDGDDTGVDDEDDTGVDDGDDTGVDDEDDAGVDDDDSTDADDDAGADDGTDTDDDDDPEDEEQPGFGIAVALIALLAAAGIALRNRA